MTEPIQFLPDAWYDAPAVRIASGISETTLARARKAGQLRHTRRGGRILYLGRWLMDWLAGEPIERREPVGVPV
jgi:hypothetical protein